MDSFCIPTLHIFERILLSVGFMLISRLTNGQLASLHVILLFDSNLAFPFLVTFFFLNQEGVYEGPSRATTKLPTLWF